MYHAYIVDVDGTLYSQLLLRAKMAVHILCYLVVHPRRLKDIYAVWRYRKLCERSRNSKVEMLERYETVGRSVGLTAGRVQEAVTYWMKEYPLRLLSTCAYNDVIQWLNARKRQGDTIYIYSDYPAVEKLRVLNVAYDRVFVSEEIGLMKPSMKAMEWIVGNLDCPKDEVLYIGDRDDIDGASARSVGIDYVNIRRFNINGKA